MTRRPALALAFLLTAVLGFWIVAYGSRSGLFAWTGTSGQARSAATPAANATPGSDVIVYLDQVVPTPAGARLDAAGFSQDDDDRDGHERSEREGGHVGGEHEDDDD